MARSQIKGLTIKIGGDTTALDKALTESDKKLRGIQSDLKKVEDALKLDPGNMDLLAEKQRLLSDILEESKKRADNLRGAAEEMNRRLEAGEINVDQYHAFNQELILAESRARQAEQSLHDFREEMDRLSDSADDADDDLGNLDENLGDLDDGMEDLDDSTDKSTEKLGKLSGVAAGVAIAIGEKLVSAVTDAISAMWGLDEATEEYRVAMGKLNTAFETAGYNIETAQKTYQGFYRILGDTDTATEASQLLAQLADSEEDLAKWTNIAAGVYGTFGDSLPIEGLIEAANETVKTGQVTGVLADALNWVGISEERVNERLSEMSSESQRAQYLMRRLSGSYSDAAAAFYENNKALIASRDAQARLDMTLAQLGESMSEIKSAFKEFSTVLLETLNPALERGMEAVKGFVENGTAMLNNLINAFQTDGLSGLMDGITSILSNIAQKVADMIPDMIDSGVEMIHALAQGMISNLPAIGDAALDILSALLDGLLDGLPKIGEDLFTGLMMVIREGVPALADTAVNMANAFADKWDEIFPGVVNSIFRLVYNLADKLIKNAPKFLEAGITIVSSLLQGLVDYLPTLLEWIPFMITNLTNTLAENLPQIVEMAFTLAATLAKGLIEAIPVIVAAIPDIVVAIVEGFGKIWGTFAEIGINIVKEIVNGIISAAKDLADTVGDAILSILPFGKEKSVSTRAVVSDTETYPYALRPITAEDLPHLARGAVVRPNNPFLAVVGDNPEEPEVISPYSTIRQAMDDSLRSAGRSTGSQGPTSAVMQLDGRTFARLEVPYIMEEFRRLGIKFGR